MTRISDTLTWHTMADRPMLKNETRYLCHYSLPFGQFILLIYIDGKFYDDENGEGQPFAEPDRWAEFLPDAP